MPRTKTYHATLRGDRIEWNGDGPPPLPADKPIPVEITVPVVETMTDAERGARMVAILEKLAARNPFAEIDDPVAWQKEQRRDRPLPGRDE